MIEYVRQNLVKDTVAIFSFVTLAVLVALAAVVLTGCSTIDSAYDWYRDKRDNKPPVEEPAQPDKPTEPEKPPVENIDQVDYSLFRWTYGGENMSRATYDESIIISMAGIAKNGISYRWQKGNPQTWGAANANDHEKALVCAFLLNDKGEWVGGKFDWVSTDRLSRDFGHFTHYKGWNLGGIPNPTRLAFVVVEPNGRRRSNVIAGEWRR